ncbi:deoxyribonuclease IV [bacterium]|nr:deoxyribonuclease IV [bacterium]
MRIGCHISISGGIQNAPKRAASLDCETMQIFTRPPQGGKSSSLTNKICEEFKIQNSKFKIRNIYIHCPYYINLASANNRVRYGSARAVRDELERASLIGAKYVVVHLGSAKDLGEKKAIKQVVKILKKTLDGYDGSAKLLPENTAGAGKIIGDSFSELAKIIKLVNNKNIAGICMDTQHSFASGYDWTNFENTFDKIKSEIDINLIKLIHSNDSLVDCGSRKDRHANIGKGKIGLNPFKKIVKFAVKNNVDMICETAMPGVKEDIEILKKMRDLL